MLNDMLEMLRDIAGDDDTDFMLDLVESYQSHTPVLLAAIEAAHSQGEVAGMEIAAHQLKSSSAMLGCTAFSVQCGDLEKACKADETDPATLAALVEAIRLGIPLSKRSSTPRSSNSGKRRLRRHRGAGTAWDSAPKYLVMMDLRGYT